MITRPQSDARVVSTALLMVIAVGSTTYARPAHARAEAPPQKSVAALYVDEPPKIDGRPDDACWQLAETAGDFVERSPNLGGTPKLDTQIKVAYDEVNLYVLVRGELDADAKPRVMNLRRDSFRIFSDDTVSIKIDAQHDRSAAFIFTTNLAGAQFDSMSLRNGRLNYRAWDAVWESKGSRVGDSYYLEYEIPFSTMGVRGPKPGEPALTMGFEASRDDPAHAATYDWRLITPPQSPMAATAFGTLTGLEKVGRGRALEIIPYFAAGTDFNRAFSIDPRNDANLAAGVDLRFQTAQASYVEASLLTDFSQVDIDDVQVASDRFPLYYDERRPFFINGLDVFYFGLQREAQIFFSRRIGLDGRAVPIAAGAKAYGRAGRVSYGLLDVQTLGRLAQPEEDEDAIAPENVLVGRVLVELGRYLSVGALSLGRFRSGGGDGDASTTGVDFDFQADEGRLRIYGFAAGNWERNRIEEEEPTVDAQLRSGAPAATATADEDMHAAAVRRSDRARAHHRSAPAGPELTESQWGSSAAVQVDYRGLYVRPSADWLWSSEDFNAPLGYYRRPGTARQRAKLIFAPRPDLLGLRDIQFGPRVSLTTAPDYSDILTSDMGAELEFNWRSGWRLRYDTSFRDDHVEEAFDLYGYEVTPGPYSSGRHQVNLRTPNNRAVSGEISYERGQIFGARPIATGPASISRRVSTFHCQGGIPTCRVTSSAVANSISASPTRR